MFFGHCDTPAGPQNRFYQFCRLPLYNFTTTHVNFFQTAVVVVAVVVVAVVVFVAFLMLLFLLLLLLLLLLLSLLLFLLMLLRFTNYIFCFRNDVG
jgi:uncharacterized membrane protein